MGPPYDEIAARLASLERRVDSLERERRLETEPVAIPALQAVAAVQTVPGGIMPVLGRALLGIAGAYLLRAIAESGTIPQLAAVVAGLVYACWWLLSSSRVASGNRFTTAVYGITSALIVSPMLWETTVRFQVLNPLVTAAVLVCFVMLGAVLAWPRNLTSITWITTLAGVATSVALIVATREVVAFTAALLLIAVVVEYAACRDHWLSERWIVAFTIDFSVLLVSYLVTRPNGVPEGYPPIPIALVIAIQIALLSIYLGSTVYRTLIHGLSITSFEIGQAVVAFLISIGGALEVTKRATGASAAVGIFCIVSGVACYLVAFSFLEHKAGRRRNFYTYTSFALALIVTALYVLTSGIVLAATWSAIGVLVMWGGERFERTTLRTHAAVYLLAAAIASGENPGLWIVALAAACSYALNRSIHDGPASRIPAAAIVAILCWAAIVPGVDVIRPSDAAVASAVRTAIICVLAIVMAWTGPRWKRPELIWLLYPLMGLGAIKLLVEDFRTGRPLTVCLSLLFYGGALVLVPRLVRGSASQALPRQPAILS